MRVQFIISFLTLIPAAWGQAADIYDESQITQKGCKCTSRCFTGALWQCYASPVCSVASKDCPGGTATWSIIHGYSDYCVYGEYKPYESRTAAQKQELVLAHVQSDTSPGTYPNRLSVLAGVISESVMVSFDASSDVFPESRKKYIHSVGMVGGISFVSVGGHPYTGVFEGAQHGLIRLSSAAKPGGSFTPGAAFKFFRDGRRSANFVAMPSLDGQPCSNSNFFANDFKTHISATNNFGLKLIAAKFWQASYCPLMVGLSDVASATDDVFNSVFPFELVLHPLVNVSCPCDAYTTTFAAALSKLELGTKLFEVRAIKQFGDPSTVIGHIELSTKLTTSKFGDEQLFFRHQRMEDDFALKPEWLADFDHKEQCGMAAVGTTAPLISKGCQSPFHGDDMVLSMRDDDAQISI
eukprot:TRINITY_DN22844_c0_g1_i1.p1 TRINITY_DN22844_c0_g1~~TRINITY_DN22844_c0_g1_i1.p1  ORF type:complete len:410 (-),score=49.83 TRINITY_DN22844_c0_g1_i1:138-1367(-)